MSAFDYDGRERRVFRRFDVTFSVYLAAVSPEMAEPERREVEGKTINISFGGALVQATAGRELAQTIPVRVRFADHDGGVRPDAPVGRVRGVQRNDAATLLGIEFELPLVLFTASTELADRWAWLEEMGGESFVGEIIGLFLESSPVHIVAAADARRVGDLEAGARAVHSLKSSASNVGAVNLAEVARRAEVSASNGDAEAAWILVDKLPEYFDAVTQQLERRRSGGH